MATDYDAPRKTDDDLSEDSLEELKARRVDKASSIVDVDEAAALRFQPGPCADRGLDAGAARAVDRVRAQLEGLLRCFLVHHRSQLAKNVNGQMVCRECVA